MKLFVGCLPYSRTEADLEPVFSQFGPVEDVTILKGPNGQSKGAGFVTFQDEESAATAMTYLSSYVFEGATRPINLSYASSDGSSKKAGGPPPPQYAMAAQPRGQPQRHTQPPPPPPMSMMQHMGPATMQAMPGSKLFVGQLPFSRTEDDLIQLFSSVGPVMEVILLRDKKTQEKKGAAFVRYQSPHHAHQAVSALNGFLFSGSTRAITVSLAQNDGGGEVMAYQPLPGQKRARPTSSSNWMGVPAPAPPKTSNVPSEPGSKLFIGQLPFSRSEEDLKQIFGTYGDIIEVILHRDQQGQKKGGAFVRFENAAAAEAALELDGFLFQGSTRPIIVSIAGEGGPAKKRRSD